MDLNHQINTLEAYISRVNAAPLHALEEIDRAEVVAHAALSGLVHHWPEKATDEILVLLSKTQLIREAERSRWIVQRRIAIVKWQRFLEASSS